MAVTESDLPGRTFDATARGALKTTRVEELAESANAIGTKLLTRLSKLEAEVQVAHERHRAEADRLAKEPRTDGPGFVVNQTAREFAAKMAESRTKQFRDNITKSTEQERIEALRQLNSLGEKVATIAPLFQSPVQMLSRHGLGSEERSRFQAQLANAGRAEIQAMAEYAIAMDDKTLGAAVLARIDAMPSDQRPFAGAAAALAEVLVGAEHKKIRQLFAAVRNRLNECITADRSFRTGQAKPSFSGLREALNREAETEINILDEE